MTALAVTAALLAGPITQPTVTDVTVDGLETHAALVWHYDYWENSPSVARLQAVLDVPVDGVYGPQTFDVHGLWLAYHGLDDTRPTPPPSPAPAPAVADTATTAPPTPTSPSEWGGWGELIARYFPPEWQQWAARIVQCESGGNPNAYNPTSGASGLFQHLESYWPARAAAAGFPGASPFDPVANTAAAAHLLATGGPGHWVCQ